MNARHSNRLMLEKSPYLLQHANNPVNWYPWSEEAFAQARQTGKPIFLSIGYSTCHWCHVMERESFENEEIAGLLNAWFVSIKVDREERPDVDRVYMTALQAMGQNGGWPMSMFLTGDLKPFYGGTYFPPDARYGRAGFPDVLRRIHEIWESEQKNIQESADAIHRYLNDVAGAKGGSAEVDRRALDRCFEQLGESYDPAFGGFSRAPKFPRPSVFSHLLRYHVRTGNPDAREMVEHTLRRMALGGMYDQIGGGFHRYAVDGEWRVPHFEKMLYDQAQLSHQYLECFRVTADPFFASVAREVLQYVMRDMRSSEGGFFSAEDADSVRPDDSTEEGEGAFYLWTKKEITAELGEDADLFCAHYGIEEEGNAPFDPQHEFTGRNILYVPQGIEASARMAACSVEEAERRLERSRRRLLATRSSRPRPLRDDKILVSWNGLMISAFAHAFQVFGDQSYLSVASQAAGFVLRNLRDAKTGGLVRRYRDGEARFPAHLDDYAFFVQALIDLYESTGEASWLAEAARLTDLHIAVFSDSERGGFFDTAGNDPSVLVRMKEQYDGAEPAGNSVAALNLLRLAELLERPEWEELGKRTLDAFAPWLAKQPAVMPQMLAALDFALGPRKQVVIVGERGDERTEALQRVVLSGYRPRTSVLYAGRGDKGAVMATFAANLPLQEGRPTAYVCENFVCRLPTSDPGELARQLV